MDAETAQIIRDIAVAFAASVTAYIALNGLLTGFKDFKRKLIEGNSSSVACELRRLTYSLRDQIRYFCFAGTRDKELPEGYKDFYKNSNNLSEDEIRKVLQYKYSNRFKALNAVLRDFNDETFKAEALWGKSIKKKTDKLRNCISLLEYNLKIYIESFAKNKSPEYSIFGEDKEIRMIIEDFDSEREDFDSEEFRKESFAKLDKTNKFISRVKDAVKEIESEIQRHFPYLPIKK